ncbi:MAG: helix-turn-helix transcriptional regulator [Paenibacillaceae bacterium]
MNDALLGKRIRMERNKLNMTQETLAEKVDLSDAYIGQIERGERKLSLHALIKLSNALGVTVDYLLHDYIEIDDDGFINQIKQIMLHRSPKEKQMMLDMIKLMSTHLDDILSEK